MAAFSEVRNRVESYDHAVIKGKLRVWENLEKHDGSAEFERQTYDARWMVIALDGHEFAALKTCLAVYWFPVRLRNSLPGDWTLYA